MAGVLKGLLAFDNATSHSYIELLVRYRTSFHNYSVGMKYGSELFKYLDRHWVTTNHCETGRSPKNGVSVYRVSRARGCSAYVRVFFLFPFFLLLFALLLTYVRVCFSCEGIRYACRGYGVGCNLPAVCVSCDTGSAATVATAFDAFEFSWKSFW